MKKNKNKKKEKPKPIKKNDSGRDTGLSNATNRLHEGKVVVDNRDIDRRNDINPVDVLIKNNRLERKDVVIVGEKIKNPFYKYLIVSIICMTLLLMVLLLKIMIPPQVINETVNATVEVARASI